MPNLSDRVADLFSRNTPQLQEGQSTVISHSEVVESGSPVAEERIVDAPSDDIDMADVVADQLLEVAKHVIPTSPKKNKTPKSSTKATPAKPTSKSATKSSAESPAKSAPKSPKSPKAKAPPKKAKKESGPTTEWEGMEGPDNAVAVAEDGEQEWEISKICKVEENGKTLVVKWKGWKGFWPEDYDSIKEQVPKLVKEFEKDMKAKGITGKRGRPKSIKSETTTAAKSTSTSTGAKRGRPAGSKKTTKPITAAAASTKTPKAARQTTASKGRPIKVTKSPKKATGPIKATAPSPAKAAGSRSKAATATPKKGTTKAPAQAAASAATPVRKTATPKKTAGKASGSGVGAKRGRPKKG